MTDNLPILTITFLSVLVFGVTSLLILRSIRLKDEQLVKSVANQKKWYAEGDIDLKKYFQVYREYYKEHGFNLILLLNIISYPTIVLSALYDVIIK